MSTNFTPGPWRVEPAEDWPINVYAGDGRAMRVCRVDSDTDFGNHCAANVNIIAAAPDLYEAVEYALQWLSSGDAIETFERVADWFYQETGFLAPGKSYPDEAPCTDEAERWRMWESWRKGKQKAIYQSLESALAKARGEVSQ